jgi:serine/threonine protein kinase/Flp pilus assembly protein TadD
MQMQEQTIFIEALEQEDPAARAAFLDRACAGDAALRERIDRLLQRHAQADSFLQSSVTAAHAAPAELTAREGPGTLIGPYKLLQQIGEGGMGTVFLAEQQDPVKRLVALKLIKPGMDSRQVIGRFEQERQALALMDHPNIATVLDADTTASGRPYFVMELVKGVPITNYCDEHRLTPRQRLELFVPVCQAVQHAHQKGIIHRDIKPSNVLIALYDGRPVPKVIDFGIAKAAGEKLTEKTLFTEFGAVVGTLEYMSPEQAELNQLDIDTRSDIYSLGVLLYELLTGTTPLERKRLKGGALLEVLQRIREEEPPTPSTRLSTTDELPAIAANRGLEPRKLSGLVRGELDWVVMKALDKDRGRRYQTANDFAADVQRYLHDEPVQAGPPSTTYRLKKFLRRNRGLVLASALVLLALLGTVVGTTVGLVRAEEARQLADRRRAEADTARNKEAAERVRAEQEKQIAQAVRNFFNEKLLRQADSWVQADALLLAGGSSDEAKENPTIRELLDRAARELTPDKIEARFPKQPRVQAEILHMIGDTYRGIGAYRPAIAHLRRAASLQQRELGPDHPNTLKTRGQLAFAYYHDWKLTEAIRRFEQLREQLLQKRDADPRYTLYTLHSLALTYLRADRRRDAIRLLEEVAEKQARQLGNDHTDTLTTLHNLAIAYHDAGQRTKAIHLLEQVLEKDIRKRGANHPATLGTLRNLAELLRQAGKLGEAIPRFEKVHATLVAVRGPDHPKTLSTLSALANAYREAGKVEEAIRLYKQAYDKRVAALGPNHPDTLSTLQHLAVAHVDAAGTDPEKLAPAIRLLEQVRDKQTLVHGPGHAATLETMHQLAGAYRIAGQVSEAIALFEQVRDKRIQKVGADHPQTLETLYSLALAYRFAKQLDRSTDLFEQVLARCKVKLGVDHPFTLVTMGNLGINYRDAGRLPEGVALLEEVQSRIRKLPTPIPTYLDDLPRVLAATYERTGQRARAEPLHREALDQARKQFGAVHAKTAAALATLGTNLLYQNKPARAEPRLRECLAILARTEHDPWLKCQAQSALGQALWFQHRPAEAAPLFAAAYEGMKQRQSQKPDPARSRDLLIVARYLVDVHKNWGKQPDELAKWQNELATLLAPGQAQAVGGPDHALAREPKDAWDWFNRGVAHLKQGRLDKALADLNQAIKLKPKTTAFLMNRSAVHTKLGELEKALADLDEAIKLGPRFPGLRYTRGSLLHRLGRYEKAAADCSEFIALAPKDEQLVRVYLLRAQAHSFLGRFQEALADNQKALKLAPTQPGPYSDLGVLLANCPDPKVRNPEQAVEMARKAVELWPASGSCWYVLGVAHYRCGNWQSALDALNKAKEMRKGGSTFDWLFLAMAHRQLGNLDAARLAYDRAIQQLENNPQTLAKNVPATEALRRFRSEAEEVLELKKK